MKFFTFFENIDIWRCCYITFIFSYEYNAI